MRLPVPSPKNFSAGFEDHFLSEFFCLRVDNGYERQRVDWASPLLREYAVMFPLPSEAPVQLKAGLCFHNALSGASIPGMVYCEGIIRGADLFSGKPIAAIHAWCYHPLSGQVFDLTVGYGAGIRLSGSAVQYIGIPFATSYAKVLSAKQGFYGFLDGHPEHGDNWGPYKDPSAWWLHPCWSSLGRYHGPL